MSELDMYAQLVKFCAENKINRRISNGTPHHARILIAKLFEVAQRDAVILSGHLTDQTADGIDIYGHQPVVDAAKKFLRDPNASLSIILRDGNVDRGENNRFLQDVVNDTDRCGTVKVILGDMLPVDAPHFMACDRYAYRFEERPDPTKTEAIANFGDPDTGRDLARNFDEMAELLRTAEATRTTLYGPSDRLPRRI